MNEMDLMGINEERIKKMVLNIYDYAEQINTILNSIDDAISEASKCLIIDGNEILQKNFSSVKNNFVYVKSNILSYADELLKAESDYLRTSEEIAIDLRKAAENIDYDNKNS